MLNFSQINSKKTKQSKAQVNAIRLEFKIQQPNDKKISKQLTSQKSCNEQSSKGESLMQKVTEKSYSKEKLQQQYISFKIKPAQKSAVYKLQNTKDQIKLSNRYEAGFENNFQESRQQLILEENNSLAKSPQFFYKKSSEQNSFKDSFVEQKIIHALKCNQKQKENIHSFNSFNRLSYPKNNRIVTFDKSLEYRLYKDQKYKGSEGQFKQQNFTQQYDVDFHDSIIEDKIQQTYTPYKQLKEEFQKQTNLYTRELRLNDIQQFDSFSQSHNVNFKENDFSINQRNNHNYNNFESFEMRSNRKYQNGIPNQDTRTTKTNKENLVDSNSNKKGFFFLTNPSLQSNYKQNQAMNNVEMTQKTACNQMKKFPTQKQVKQFCFNLSQINLQNQKEFESHCNRNLFSNSNDYLVFFDSKNLLPSENLMFFESKNGSKQSGSISSKKSHVRQLVEEFIDQLQHLDERSLNEKVVNNLENVLEQIIFKQPKTKQEPIKINDEIHEHQPYSQTKVIDRQGHFKKWQRPSNLPNSTILTQRKVQREFQNYSNNSVIQLKDRSKQHNKPILSNYMLNKVSPSHSFIPRKHQRSLSSSNKSTTRKPTEKQMVYKPNFNLNVRKSIQKKKLNQQKQNITPCKSFTNIKNRPDSSEIKINPKGSVYFNKCPKSNRQHLKTQYDQPNLWRIY